MQITLRSIRFAVAVAVTALLLTGAQPNAVAFAQTPTTSAALSEATIKFLQEALNKQGIATNSDGVLNDQTRASIRKYQSQHHLPVTGEPDKATLDKLGVAARQSAAPGGQTDQATQGGTAPGTQMMAGGMMPRGMMQGGMMNCPMMQSQAAAPSGMIRGGMQMQSGQTPQGGVTDREMMQSMMQMMQMMHGMMQIMHAQMQRQQTSSGQMTPMQPSAMPQGPIHPGPMQQGPR